MNKGGMHQPETEKTHEENIMEKKEEKSGKTG